MKLAKDRAHKLMQEFYLSPSYDPKAERPADVVQAAIEFALSTDRAPADVEGPVERLRHEAPICLKIAQAVHALRKQLDPAFDEPPPTDNSASATMAAAADTILSLQAKVSRLEGALEPFKVAADMADERMLGRYAEANLPDDTTVIGALNLTLGHLRGARAALTEPPSKYGHGSAGPENNEG